MDHQKEEEDHNCLELYPMVGNCLEKEQNFVVQKVHNQIEESVVDHKEVVYSLGPHKTRFVVDNSSVVEVVKK